MTRLLIRCGAGLGVVALLVFLFIQSLATNADNHQRAMDRLREMKEMDAALNQDVLKARYGFLSNYDPLVLNIRRLRALLDGLTDTVSTQSFEEKQAAHTAREALEEAVASKERIIEDIKSYNAILNNSVRYLSVADNRLVQSGDDPDLALEVGNLLRDALLYNLVTSQDIVPRIQKSVQTLRAANHPPRTKAQLDLLFAHVTTILNYKQDTDAITARMLAIPCARHCDELSTAFQ